MVENNILYKYSGTNNSWSWSQVKRLSDSEFSKTSTRVEVHLDLPVQGVGFYNSDGAYLGPVYKN